MRKPYSDLSFESYLKKYVMSLSQNKTQSLKKLLFEASTSNQRLVEPLILYIHFTDLNKTYSKFAFQCSEDFKMKYLQIKLNYPNKKELYSDLENKKCSNEFNKVYASYLYQKNRKIVEDDLKNKMIQKIILLAREKQISRYRIAKELKLNPGNLNSFLNHHKTNALSMKKSLLLLNYLSASQ